MSGVGRYVKFTAQPGRGDELARLLLRAADSVRVLDGCELYVINAAKADPDVVWVTELWLDRESLDASLEQLQTEAGRAQIAEVTALLAGPPERIDLDPLGGVGYRALDTRGTGVSHQRLRPGVRQAFGHRHQHAEGVVVVLGGSGRVKIDDELRDVRALDGIRFAPNATRAFEAGADGLELLVFGARHPGDAVVDRTFWPPGTA